MELKTFRIESTQRNISKCRDDLPYLRSTSKYIIIWTVCFGQPAEDREDARVRVEKARCLERMREEVGLECLTVQSIVLLWQGIPKSFPAHDTKQHNKMTVQSDRSKWKCRHGRLDVLGRVTVNQLCLGSCLRWPHLCFFALALDGQSSLSLLIDRARSSFVGPTD